MRIYHSDVNRPTGLKVMVPGISEKIKIQFLSYNYSMVKETHIPHFTVNWHHKDILNNINSSLILNSKQYLLFTESMNTRRIVSWEEAQRVCIAHGSSLPSFSSQSDVQEIIDIILRAAWTGPIRMIFIGLRVKKIYFKFFVAFRYFIIFSAYKCLNFIVLSIFKTIGQCMGKW